MTLEKHRRRVNEVDFLNILSLLVLVDVFEELRRQNLATLLACQTCRRAFEYPRVLLLVKIVCEVVQRLKLAVKVGVIDGYDAGPSKDRLQPVSQVLTKISKISPEFHQKFPSKTILRRPLTSPALSYPRATSRAISKTFCSALTLCSH